VDVRIISAANKSLKEQVRSGRFREDLYYRLNVIPIHLPPLRERKNDIPLLAAHFLKQAEQENNAPMPVLAGDTLNLLLDYDWPGNVRELKNVIQFSVVRCRGKQILPSDLPPEITRGSGVSPVSPTALAPEYPQDTLPETGPVRGRLDAASVKAALTRTGGNKSKAARLLGIGRATLYRFLNNNPDAREFSQRF
jgi:DNA-binding NtrC family response regulator